MAAASLGMAPPLIAELIHEIDHSWPEPAVDLGLVEGAGGVASPLAGDGDTAALAKALSPDLVVLVAEAGLGTINAVRLSRSALQPLPVVVYLNRFDQGQELHERNRAWLVEVDGLEVCCDRDDLASRVLALAGV
jgi:dethiobiotin synthetase